MHDKGMLLCTFSARARAHVLRTEIGLKFPVNKHSCEWWAEVLVRTGECKLHENFQNRHFLGSGGML